MNIAKSKRTCMAAAAVFVLLFHLWIPVFAYGTAAGRAERFLIAIGYIGVDMFFFLSGYTLALRPVTDYGAFLKDRAVKLLPLFLIAYLAGQKLWFIPSLMAVYLVFPPLQRFCTKRPGPALPLLIAGWIVLVIAAEGLSTPKQNFGIFLFRIPITVIGAYAAGLEGRLEKRTELWLAAALLIPGTWLLWEYGYLQKLTVPYTNTFYLAGIPATLGVLLLCDVLGSSVSLKPVEKFGGITLELYFTQLVLGTAMVELFFGLTKNRIVTNLLTFGLTIAISFLLAKLYTAATRKFSS